MVGEATTELIITDTNKHECSVTIRAIFLLTLQDLKESKQFNRVRLMKKIHETELLPRITTITTDGAPQQEPRGWRASHTVGAQNLLPAIGRRKGLLALTLLIFALSLERGDAAERNVPTIEVAPTIASG